MGLDQAHAFHLTHAGALELEPLHRCLGYWSGNSNFSAPQSLTRESKRERIVFNLAISRSGDIPALLGRETLREGDSPLDPRSKILLG
jgi:hypothetical protein